MEVRPKRNKVFICDQCDTEINTKKGNYNKIIIVTFVDGRKFRNKFCSTDCYDKWKLVNKPNLKKAPLEVEVKKMTDEEREDYKEEEEPKKNNGNNYDIKKDAKDVSYESKNEVKYEKNEKNHKKPETETEVINILDKKDEAPNQDPELYGKKRYIREKEGFDAVNKLKDFVDNINILKYLYRKK